MTDDDLRALIDRVTDHILANGGVERPGSDEIRFRCPSPDHDDEHPSCDWNRRLGCYKCMSCGASGGAVDCAKLLDLPMSGGRNGVPPSPQPVRRRRDSTGEEATPSSSPAPVVPLPDDERWQRLVRQLVDNDSDVAQQSREFLEALGIDLVGCGWGLGYLSTDEVTRHELPRGSDGIRFLIPVRNPETGELVDVRRYAAGIFGRVDDRIKCVPWAKGTGLAAPYGWHDLPDDADTLIWCEGEKDREVLIALGYHAVSHTNGGNAAAKVARDLPAECLQGRRIAILFDADEPGRKNSRNLADVLRDRGVYVALLSWSPDCPRGFDVADLVTRDGLDAARGRVRWQLDSAKWETPPVKRPKIVLSGLPFDEKIDAARIAIETANDPPDLFVRAGVLVEVALDEKGSPIIRTVGIDALRDRMARSAIYLVRRRVDGQWKQVVTDPPKDVAASALAKPETWNIPPLDAVVQIPTLRPDGSLINDPGYDAATRLVYMPPPSLHVPAIPDQPTKMDALEAMEVAWKPFAEFPYVSDADRAHVMALLLTPVLRPAIRGPVPVAMIDAPQQGTGKSLIGENICAIATGMGTSNPAPSNPKDDEWRKLLTTLLATGATVIVFDNVDDMLASGHLSRAVTIPVWEDRALGGNKMLSSPVRCTWIVTGNNLRVGGDMARRCYRIQINAKMAEPWQGREFTIKDLRGYVAEHRGELLAALLTMARAWYAAGQPAPDSPARPIGSFEEWCRIVGGILGFAGVPGFLSNLDQLYDEADPDASAWRAFLEAWAARYGEEPVTVKQLCDAIEQANSDQGSLDLGDDEESAEALAETFPTFLLDRTGKPNRRSLGRALNRIQGRRYPPDDIRLDPAQPDGTTKRLAWKVVSGTEEPEEAPGVSGVSGVFSTRAPIDTQTDIQPDLARGVWENAGNARNAGNNTEGNDAQDGWMSDDGDDSPWTVDSE